MLSTILLIALTDPNEPKSSGETGDDYPQSPFGKSGEVIPFTSPEDIMKNLPKVMSNVFGTGIGMPANSPTFKLTMKEYEDMAIKVGDKVGMEINKVDENST
jgi:hypothetical protein